MRPESSPVCRTCGRPPTRYLSGGECATCARYRSKTGLTRPYGLGDGRTVAVLRGPEHPSWRGDAARRETKHKRARKRYPDLGPCQRCGAPATERHHRDGDPGNNRPSNVALLCRRCHMELDGRLAKLIAAGVPYRQERVTPKPCAVCGRLAKPLRRGRCHSCDEYLRRNGVDRSAPMGPLMTTDA